MVFQVKPIKPDYLQVDTVRLELLNALRKEGTASKKLLRQTTENWQGEKPQFKEKISLAGGDTTLLVYPDGSEKAVNKWNWLNEGTKPHVIVPKRAKMLRFQSGYTAGSTPNSLRTRRSRSFGETVYAKRVNHPGIKARNWTILVLKERYVPYRTSMNEALEKGLKKGGWK